MSSWPTPPADDRVLRWDGLLNGRDLGGVPVAQESAIAAGPVSISPGRLVRSGSPHLLTADGWRELTSHGITTIIDLRSPSETIDASPAPGLMPDSVTRLACTIEPPGFIERWRARSDTWKLATPHYYAEFAAAHHERIAAAVQAVAEAPPGGVLVHCSAGRDRCGLTVATILDLIGVDHAEIIADHWLSYDRPEPIEVALGRTPSPEAAALTQDEHHEVLASFLEQAPAHRCFDSPTSAEETKRRLLDRLVA